MLLPTLHPGPGIEPVLQAIFGQEAGFEFEVLVVDSGSSEAELESMRRFPVRLWSIPKAEFGHGPTRNLLAREATGSALVFLTQDAQPLGADWLATLVGTLDEPGVAGAYSRQVPRPGADPFVSFFLAQMYPASGCRIQGRQRLQPGRVLFSNVGSALRRDVWERLPFRDVIMSEDQYWAWDVLRAGYEVAYEARAKVLHSHNYSLATLFRRNWQSGASLRGLVQGSAGHTARRGAAYLAGEARHLLVSGAMLQLPRMVAYELVRTGAFWLGFRWGRAGRT